MMIRACSHVSLGVLLGIYTIVAPARAEQSLSDRICKASLQTKRNQISKTRDETDKAGEAAGKMGGAAGKVQEAMNSYKTMYGDMERLNPPPPDIQRFSSSGDPLPRRPEDFSQPKPAVTPIEFYDESMGFSRSDKSGKGVARLNRSIALAPDFAYAYAWRARQNTNRKSYAAALADYDRLRQLDPKRTTEVLMAQAQIYSQMKEWDKVVEIYNKLQITEPKESLYFYILQASVYAELNKWDKVIDQFNQAIALPKNFKGSDEFRQRVEKWLPKFSTPSKIPNIEVVSYNPFDSTVYIPTTFPMEVDLRLTRARIYAIQKNKKSAIADYQALIESYRSGALALRSSKFIPPEIYRERCGTFMVFGDISAARADSQLAQITEQKIVEFEAPRDTEILIFSTSEALPPPSPPSWTWIGDEKASIEAALKQGLRIPIATQQPQVTIDLFTQAIALDRNYAPAYYSRGLAHIKQNNFKAAIEDFSEAIRLNPEFSLAYSARASAHQENDNIEPALKDFDRALTTDPTLASANLGRGQILLKQQQWKSAAESFTQTLEADPEMLEALEGRSIARKNLNDLAGSLTDQTRAKQIRDR